MRQKYLHTLRDGVSSTFDFAKGSSARMNNIVLDEYKAVHYNAEYGILDLSIGLRIGIELWK